MSETQGFVAAIERHHADLPVYLIVPTAVVDAFARQRTFVVEAEVDGQKIGRRSIKPWGDGRWFMELTKAQCRRLAVGPGSRVEVAIALAEEMPADLAARIEELGLGQGWARLTEAERRSCAETVFDAKRPATRSARIERIVARLDRS